MNDWETLMTKRELFSLFENARILYNNYVNGYDWDYVEEDVNAIEKYIELIESNIKEVKETIECSK